MERTISVANPVCPEYASLHRGRSQGRNTSSHKNACGGGYEYAKPLNFFTFKSLWNERPKKKKKGGGGGVKGNSWSRKSLEKPLVFIVVSAENVGEITYSKSCRVGFAPLPVANGYVRKIMLVSCYVITISKLLWLISFPINHLTSRFLQQIFTVKKFILKLMQKILL